MLRENQTDPIAKPIRAMGTALPGWVEETPHCRYEATNTEPQEIPLHEICQPSVTTFLDYWKSLRGDRFAPAWKEFDLFALGTKSIPRVIVVDVHHSPFLIDYRFWGTANVKAKGFDMTGKSLDAYPPYRGAMAREEYRRVVNEKRPIAFTDTLVLPDADQNFGPKRAPFEQTIVRLPLSEVGALVDCVVSLCNWERAMQS